MPHGTYLHDFRICRVGEGSNGGDLSTPPLRVIIGTPTTKIFTAQRFHQRILDVQLTIGHREALANVDKHLRQLLGLRNTTTGAV
jgi:hypothetical protein